MGQVSCGWSHTAFVSEGGALWTWGTGAEGRLGHGHNKTLTEPKPVCPSPFSPHPTTLRCVYLRHDSALTVLSAVEELSCWQRLPPPCAFLVARAV